MGDISYTELEKELIDYSGSKNLLLGNGINLSIPRIGKYFQYSSIISHENIDCLIKTLKTELEPIQQKIDKKEDYDLEKIIRIIEDSKSKIIEEFTASFVTKHDNYGNFKFYIKKLAEFINQHDFSNLFTLNYDLLLYWTILHYNDKYFKNKLSSSEYIDGFWYGKLKQENEWKEVGKRRANYDSRRSFKPNLFYLHGTIYLFSGKHNQPKKISKPKDYKNFKNSKILQDYIKENIEEHDFPLIILEGNSDTKRKKLVDDRKYSPYGIFCLNALRSIEGLLLVYGCSFEQDQHILDIIKSNSKLDKVLITFTEDTQKAAILTSLSNSSLQDAITWIKVDTNNSQDNIW